MPTAPTTFIACAADSAMTIRLITRLMEREYRVLVQAGKCMPKKEVELLTTFVRSTYVSYFTKQGMMVTRFKRSTFIQ